MDKVANLTTAQRKELFSQAAFEMKSTNAIVEKDFWVVWILDKLFSDAKLQKILMFKGGTSLSKVFNLIGRFSEDIDLILDWRELTSQDLQNTALSKNKQVKLNDEINTQAKIYIKEELLPIIKNLLAPLCSCKIDDINEYNILISYPSSFSDDYLRPQVLLEIGPLASWTPSDYFSISPYVAEYFPNLFEKPSTKVKAILAKRTFWEKATILHQEANRSSEKALPLRYSRHYYDLALMANSKVKEEALKDLALLQQVVDFKMKFYPATWARFEEAKAGSFKLVPPNFRQMQLQKDYKSMEHMIFDKKLEFEDIMSTLSSLEKSINSMKE